MSKTLHVVAAVFQSGNQILACRRKPGKASGGKWEFPGGKLETGESAEGALRRELLEELHVQVRNVGELLWRETTTSSSSSIDLACYWVEADTLPVSSTDHDELRWCFVEELIQLDFAEADKPAVRELERIATGSDPFSKKRG